MKTEVDNVIEWLKLARDKSDKIRERPENYENRFFYAGKVEAYNDAIILLERYPTLIMQKWKLKED